jgi:diguanylate cyclase (GGDEF)-like protein
MRTGCRSEDDTVIADMTEEQQQLGIAELTTRLAKSGLQMIEHNRPWPNRRSTYFEIGKPGRQTDVVLSDEFICDLPGTREYQEAVDSYAMAVAGRVRCGSPNVFYCRSHLAINVAIHWPIQQAVLNNMPATWLLIHATNEVQGGIALCCLNIGRHLAYSDRTMLDDVRIATNSVRNAIDNGTVTFYDRDSHPESYQLIKDDAKAQRPPESQSEVEKFIAGKTYMLGFQIPDVPGEVYAADDWDAEYLGISRKELSQSAYVLRARGLIDLDMTLTYARPSDKLVTTGWPAAIDSTLPAPAPQVFSLSRLPKKDELLAELKNSLDRSFEIALMVIDLDKFKQVNDTKGHAEGDACLEHVVKAIGSALGRKGALYRWGGDEFAVILPDFSAEEALVTAERIRRAIEEAKAGGDISVTASLGVCATDRIESPTAEQILDSADKAMYVSKRNGKNRITSWPV